MPSIDENESAQLCNYVESMMNDSAFLHDQQNTSALMKKALIRCGLTRNNEWKLLLSKVSDVTQSQINWFESTPAPVLSEQTLCILSMALRMRDQVSVNTETQKLTVFNRPIAGSCMQIFGCLNAEFPDMSIEIESWLLLHLMCPDAEILSGTAFDATHPQIKFDTITQQLTPLYIKAVQRVAEPSNREQAFKELASLFQHLNVNFDACGLTEWAQALARANCREHIDEEDLRWKSKDYRAQIKVLLGTRAGLEENITAGELALLKVASRSDIEAESELKETERGRLKILWRQLKDDIELLCKHQPSDVDKVNRLTAEFKIAAVNRENLLKGIDKQVVKEKELGRMAVELVEPNLFGMDNKMKAARLKKLLAEAKEVDVMLSAFRVSHSASIDTSAS